MRKSVKIIMYTVCAFVIFLMLAVFIGANYVFRFVLDTSDKESLIKNVEPKEEVKLGIIDLLPDEQWLKNNGQDEYIQSHDDLILHGLYFPSEKDTNKTVIVVHGYKSSLWAMASCARHYWNNGYNVLVIEQRANGSSAGRYIGMGWLEHFDVINWVKYLVEKNNNAQIILHGFSMGAATVMLSSGNKNLPKNVYAVIEDSGFTNIKDQIAYQMKKSFGLPIFPLLNITSLVAKFRADYYFGYGDCIKAVSRAKVPILFIHGNKDDFVPFYMLKELFDAATSEKEMLIVDGAKHSNSLHVNPKLYWETVKKFLLKAEQ